MTNQSNSKPSKPVKSTLQVDAHTARTVRRLAGYEGVGLSTIIEQMAACWVKNERPQLRDVLGVKKPTKRTKRKTKKKATRRRT